MISTPAGSELANTTVAVRADAASVSHGTLIHLRALDAPPAEVTWPTDQVVVRAQTSSGCGCSAGGANWDTMALLGLLATIRRRR